MIGVKRKCPDAGGDPSPKRWKSDWEWFSDPMHTDDYPKTRRRRKFRVKRPKVFVQVFDLGEDIRLVQKIYRAARSFF
jgi:hypothetical protein